jgi:ribonuclease Z
MDFGGASVAGLETCLEVPSLGLLLDVGVCTSSAVRQPIALVSHGHLDHVGAIALHAARRHLLGMSEGTYLVPAVIAKDVEALFNAAGALDGQVIPRRIVALEPGQDFRLDGKRTIRPFATFHRVPSQGYTVWERRHHLRSELRGTPPTELADMRKHGIEIHEHTEVPVLSFTGDTRVEVLEQVPELQHTQALVIEASFLDDRVSAQQAHRMGHVHLDDLLLRTELLTAESVVLHHFSARYQEHEVTRILDARLPESVRARVRAMPMNSRDGASSLAPGPTPAVATMEKIV